MASDGLMKAEFRQKVEIADSEWASGNYEKAKRLYQEIESGLLLLAKEERNNEEKNKFIRQAKAISKILGNKERKKLMDEYFQKYLEGVSAENSGNYREATILYQEASNGYSFLAKEEDDKSLKKSFSEQAKKFAGYAKIGEGIILSQEAEQKYNKANDARDSGNYEGAKRLYQEAANNLLLAAEKVDDKKLKNQTLEQAQKLLTLSDDMKKKMLSSSEMVEVLENKQELNQKLSNLDELLEEMNSLIGLHEVKNQVKKRIYALQVEQAAKKAGASRKANDGSLHMIFSGNPGTGKTTVARLIGKIYAALGVIDNGEKFVETDRSGLVGKYVGHTAQLVTEKVNEALGGILFIDEAYSLYKEGSNLDFGEEAIATLVKCMEDHRDNIVVILAGYTDLMKNFIEKANPGLKSRFRTWINFEDYTVDEMVEIFHRMLSNKGMTISEDAEEPLYQLIEKRSVEPNFGNGRGVRNLLEDILDENNTRLAKMLQSDKKPNFDIIEAEDIYNLF